MKRIDECTDMTMLVALLVLGILLVMGAYRIFSFLCEHGPWTPGPSCWEQRACCWRLWAFCWPGAASGGCNTCGTTANNV